MRKNKLFIGALILLFANGITKVLSLAYRIFLVRILGAEGIGLVEMVSPIYAFCLVIAGWGVPLGMSRLIAAKPNINAKKVMQVAFFMLACGGISVSLLANFFAPIVIDTFLTDSRVLLMFRFYIPAILMVAVCSGFRAYFQGIKEIGILGISQNIEQIIRVAAGIFLTTTLLPYGLEIAIVGVALASVLGEAGGLAYMLIKYRKKKITYQDNSNFQRRKIASYLIRFGTPVTMQRIFSTALMMLQASLIPALMIKSGYSTSEATALYGALAGVAMTLLNIPNIFTHTLGTVVIPAIAESDNNASQLNSRINTSLYLTSIICLPLMLLLHTYSAELCILIFKTETAILPLQILSIGGFFIYIQAPIISIMQGLGRVRAIFANQIISGIIFIIAIYKLVPEHNISGASIALIAFSFVYAILNLIYLKRNFNIKYNFNRIIIKPIFATAISLIALKWTATVVTAHLANVYLLIIIPSIICLIIYAIILKILGIFPKLI